MSIRKNNGAPTFRIYQKHSLPVNMAVDISKPEIHELPKIFFEKTRGY